MTTDVIIKALSSLKAAISKQTKHCSNAAFVGLQQIDGELTLTYKTSQELTFH